MSADSEHTQGLVVVTVFFSEDSGWSGVWLVCGPNEGPGRPEASVWP